MPPPSDVIPVFTQEIRDIPGVSSPVSGAANPIVAIPFQFASYPLIDLDDNVVEIKLAGAGIIAGDTAEVSCVWAYLQTASPPGPQETLATKTVTISNQNENDGYVSVYFTPNELSLPTSYVDWWQVLNPYPFGSQGGFYGVTFISTITTSDQGLITQVVANTTPYTTGSNAGKFITIFGDCPVTVGGTAVNDAVGILDSNGGTVTVQMGINSTTDFDNNAGLFHRTVSLIRYSDGVDVVNSASSTANITAPLGVATATFTISSFDPTDYYTLNVTLGSGQFSSPTDDFRLNRYARTFTVT